MTHTSKFQVSALLFPSFDSVPTTLVIPATFQVVKEQT